MLPVRLVAIAAAACALIAMQVRAEAGGDPRVVEPTVAAQRVDGPDASGVRDGTRIALTGRPVDGLPTATQPPSATRPLSGGTVTTRSTAVAADGRGDTTLPLREAGALLLAGLLAVITLTRRHGRH